MGDTLPLLDWLDTHERKQPDWLTAARALAFELLQTREWITVDHIRERLPPPAGSHPTIMGAIFKDRRFEHTGEYVASGRDTCHRRPLGKFRLTNYARVHMALGIQDVNPNRRRP